MTDRLGLDCSAETLACGNLGWEGLSSTEAGCGFGSGGSGSALAAQVTTAGVRLFSTAAPLQPSPPAMQHQHHPQQQQQQQREQQQQPEHQQQQEQPPGLTSSTEAGIGSEAAGRGEPEAWGPGGSCNDVSMTQEESAAWAEPSFTMEEGGEEEAGGGMEPECQSSAGSGWSWEVPAGMSISTAVVSGGAVLAYCTGSKVSATLLASQGKE